MKGHDGGFPLTRGGVLDRCGQRGRLSAARVSSERINLAGLSSCLTWFKAQQMLEQQTVKGTVRVWAKATFETAPAGHAARAGRRSTFTHRSCTTPRYALG